MSVVKPSDVVAEINEIGKLYLLPDGPSTIPLDQTTIEPIRRILKLLQQIPPDLRPKQSDYQLVIEATKVIRDALQKSEGDPSQVSLLYGIPEHKFENPLSIIRRMLAWTPSLRPKEVRRKLLELAAENERSTGSASYRDDVAVFQLKNVSLGDIRRHMKILKDEELVAMDQESYGSCSIRLRTAGWKALEEPAEPTDASEDLIFISCGQFTGEERSLGKALADAVDELTPYQGYFAQNESSLEGLSRNIFGALNKCVGLVAVMHHRGNVSTPQDQHLRGSVWIEQEIAIAAFVKQTQGRDIPVVLYLQEGISLEGVRQQLHLNPVTFRNSGEVLSDFRQRIPDLFPLGRGAVGV